MSRGEESLEMIAHQLCHLLGGHLQTNRLATVMESVDVGSIVFLSRWKVRPRRSEERELQQGRKGTGTDMYSSTAFKSLLSNLPKTSSLIPCNVFMVNSALQFLGFSANRPHADLIMTKML